MLLSSQTAFSIVQKFLGKGLLCVDSFFWLCEADFILISAQCRQVPILSGILKSAWKKTEFTFFFGPF